ncbi:MAG: hypothetical protein E8D48_12455 [Nitrospira sp.]|nr:MAG: hypothetical protein E8D48_12455 [Nitrospira sp.]
MRSTKYIIVQDGDGWRGYLEGYQEQEAYGESFEELQIKLWQQHQELIAQESEQAQCGNREQDRQHGHTSTLPRHTPTTSRPMSRTQIKRKARVEQLVFAMISNR